MNDKTLDDYLQAYKSQTDHSPSRKLMVNILTIPCQSRSIAIQPWNWFDLMVPKAVGWALTCCLGIYLGLSSPEMVNNSMDEDYYMYDQAQIMFSEDIE